MPARDDSRPRSTLRRDVLRFTAAGLLLTLLMAAMGVAAGPISRRVPRGKWPLLLSPRETGLGITQAEGERSYWTVRARLWWSRTEIVADRMQVSGLNLSISNADYQASRFDLAELPASLRPGPLTDRRIVEAAVAVGFPFRSFAVRSGWAGQLGSLITWDARGGLLLGGTTPQTPDLLPLSPVWLGLTLDTIALGAAAWAVVRGPGAIRRASRRRRGLCERCAYPRVTGPCPECGG